MQTFRRKAVLAAVSIAVYTGLAAPALGQEPMLEEVVVTAQKRAQSLNDVGIAVTAFNGDSMRELNMEQPIDIASQTPGLTIKNSFGTTNPVVTIRGVGLNDFNPNNSSPAAIYIDEVYLTSPLMMSFGLFDMERVEVLKGPQGTLFGRNTTAGAVNFFTKRPEEEFSAHVEAGYGRFDRYELEGAIGGGLTDTLAGRVAFKTVQQKEGHQKNTLPGGKSDIGEVDNIGWRGQLSFTPSDSVQVLAKVHGGKDESEDWIGDVAWGSDATFANFCPSALAQSYEATQANFLNFANPAQLCVDFGSLDFLTGGLTAALKPDFTQAMAASQGDQRRVTVDRVPGVNNDALGAAVKVDWELDAGTLTSITSWDKYTREQFFDDGSAYEVIDVDYDDEIESWSQEIRFTSPGDSDLTWIAGVYLAGDTVDSSTTFLSMSATYTRGLTEYEQDTNTVAAFLHTEWQFSDQWKLTAGLRYTGEEKEIDLINFDLNPWGISCFSSPLCDGDSDLDGVPDLVAGVSLPFGAVDDDISTNDISGKLGLDYILGDELLLYASISKGFKSGGFNGAFNGGNAFDEEILWSYETGFKATLLESTLQLNGAAFYYDYQDIQVFQQIELGGLTQSVLTNADGADVYGVELEFSWLPAVGLDVKAGLGYLDTEIGELFDQLLDGSMRNLEGNSLSNTPEWSFNGLVRYEFAVADNALLSVQTDFNWQDDIFTDISSEPAFSVDDYWLVNARVALAAEDGRWEVAAWGQNILDEEYVTHQFEDAGTALYFARYFGMPATYGISARYSWE
ncbi:MAG: TonB-dependent receptor [Pseudomonadales bacterium]